MAVKVYLAEGKHQVTYDDLVALIRRQAAGVDARVTLAIAANIVGKLIAMQDQRECTPAEAMQIVQMNLEEGNRQACATLSLVPPPAGSA